MNDLMLILKSDTILSQYFLHAPEFHQRCFQFQHIRLRLIINVLLRLISQPENIQIGFVTSDQLFVSEGPPSSLT